MHAQEQGRKGMEQGQNNNGGDLPVTVIVNRTAKKGRIAEFEEWMEGIIHEAMKFEGHMGVNIIRPSEQSNLEYVIILRFNNYANLSKWEKSQARKEWIEKSRDVTEGEPRVQVITGLEFWFTPRARSGGSAAAAAADAAGTPPPRYKMVIVTIAVIFALLSTLLPHVQQVTQELPLLLQTLVGAAIMVLLMTYVVMPSVTRLLRPWLSRKGLL